MTSLFFRALNAFRRKTWPGDRYARWQGVEVGNACRILSNEFAEPKLIKIGNHVTVSTRVLFLTHDGSTWLFRDEKGRRYDYRKIEIGNHCFIGAGSILLPGVRIGDNVIVGAGSVVTRSVPSGWVVAGNPARFICHFEEIENRALKSFPSIEDFDGLISDAGILANAQKHWRPTMTNGDER